jgi:hypothetical protein
MIPDDGNSVINDDDVFLTSMTKALAVVSERPQHLVDYLNERISPRTKLGSEAPKVTSLNKKLHGVSWKDEAGGLLVEEHQTLATSDSKQQPINNVTISHLHEIPPHLGLPTVVWTSNGPSGYGRLKFSPVEFLLTQKQAARLGLHPTILSRKPGDESDPPLKLSYKMLGDSPIVRATLAAHGFREVGPTQNDFNLLWSSGKLEPHELRTLNRYQKANRYVHSLWIHGQHQVSKLVVA